MEIPVGLPPDAMRVFWPNRCLATARMRRRSDLSKTAAPSVAAVSATGEEKLRISAASTSSAAQTAQTIIVAAA